MGIKFGDPASPLLVSVRSGAAVSMPGMMDTVLNLGLNDEAMLLNPLWHFRIISLTRYPTEQSDAKKSNRHAPIYTSD